VTSQTDQSGFLDVDRGRLFYESRGDGPAIVFVHAGIADSGMWETQFADLSSDYRLVRYDMRNFGRSETEDVAFADWEDLAALLDALAIDQAVIVGASMGATVAVGLALERPALVSGLILMSPGIFPGHQPSGELQRGWRSIEQALDAGDTERALDHEVDLWVGRSKRRSTPLSEDVHLQVRRMNARAWELASDAPNRKPLRPPAFNRLDQITVPVLIVTGSLDLPDTDSIARRLERGVPNVERIDIPDTAHLLNMEQPERFNEIVREFLRSCSRSTTARD
jgi:pimeloyl-ACP methyl ester carboxylesterase